MKRPASGFTERRALSYISLENLGMPIPAYVEWNGKKREMVGIGNNAFEECILSALYGWRYLQPMGFLPLSAGKCHFEP